jgi:hypothetical protein
MHVKIIGQRAFNAVFSASKTKLLVLSRVFEKIFDVFLNLRHNIAGSDESERTDKEADFCGTTAPKGAVIFVQIFGIVLYGIQQTVHNMVYVCKPIYLSQEIFLLCKKSTPLKEKWIMQGAENMVQCKQEKGTSRRFGKRCGGKECGGENFFENPNEMVGSVRRVSNL